MARRRRRNFIEQGTYLRDRLAAMDAPGDPSYAGPFVTKSGSPYPSYYRRKSRRRRKTSMARRRSHRGRFVSRRRRVVSRRRRYAPRRRVAVSGRRTLRGRVSVRRRTFTLRRRSKFKRRLRGFRINPGVMSYMMNGRRRRRRSGGYRRNPAGVMKAVQGVFDLRAIQHGATATVGALSTIVVGNLAQSYVMPYLPAQISTGYAGIAVKAAVRGGVAWALDAYVVPMVTRDRQAFRVGSAIGIFGSAILELLGKSLVIGAGDQAQTVQQFVPTGLAAYVPKPLAAYTPRPRLMGVAPAGNGVAGVGLGALSSGHSRIYDR